MLKLVISISLLFAGIAQANEVVIPSGQQRLFMRSSGESVVVRCAPPTTAALQPKVSCQCQITATNTIFSSYTVTLIQNVLLPDGRLQKNNLQSFSNEDAWNARDNNPKYKDRVDDDIVNSLCADELKTNSQCVNSQVVDLQ